MAGQAGEVIIKLMIAGDWHGDTPHALSLIRKAKAQGIAHIMVVGDYGYWPHFKDGIEFLDATNALARELDVMIYWLDGNHENFDAIEAMVKHLPKDDNGRVWLRSHIRYCSRGAAWTWDGKRFMTVGGAVSVDRDNRVWQEQRHGQTRRLWWPQEQLTTDELLFAINKATIKPVDYLFTHDCPSNAPFQGRLKDDPDSTAHRQKMDELGKAVKPRLWFHGHMHTRYDGYDFPMYEPTTKVYGLEANPEAMHGYGTGSFWGILDTETDRFTFGPDLVQQDYQANDEVVNDDF